MMHHREDLAHIAVRATHDAVGAALDEEMRVRGYARLALRGRVHLLSLVNWDSPYDPPPEFRCFLLLPEQQGWTTIVDELDLLDLDLCASLSQRFTLLTSRGAQALGEYEHIIWVGGRPVEDPQPGEAQILAGIRGTSDHVTRFTYDELALTLADRLPLDFRGYRQIGAPN